MTETTKIYYGDITKTALDNRNYIKAVYTVPGQQQIVVMSLKADSDTELKTLKSSQYIMSEQGTGLILIRDGDSMLSYPIRSARRVLIPAGKAFTILNTSGRVLKLSSIITPPLYPSNYVEKDMPKK